jgi:hypothetical protein
VSSDDAEVERRRADSNATIMDGLLCDVGSGLSGERSSTTAGALARHREPTEGL